VSHSTQAESDFWWMSEDEASEFRFVFVGHHTPTTNLVSSFELPWFHGAVNRVLVADKVCHPVDWLPTWRDICSNVNVYRSLKVFSSPTDTAKGLMGPLLIDIDVSTDSIKDFQHRIGPLQDALVVARKTCAVLSEKWQLSSRGFRVFFSGQKGFHIEIKPSSVGIHGTLQEQLKQIVDRLLASLQNGNPPTSHNYANSQESVVIDRVYGTRRMPELNHPYVRLHGSFNLVVIGSRCIRQRKIPLSLDQVYRADISKIVGESQL